ncbi:DUF6585 family protein [Streptomyces fradiae]|uniref:DUF6585 family protein n=1 Tax=Streptomyces fradiae TaxID=1906 RepID=UPI0036556893
MSGGGAPRGRDEELVLARISAAAGRAGLGRRYATHRAPRTETGARWGAAAFAGVRRLLGSGTPEAVAGARLDLYERGVTVFAGGRVRAVRFDSTVVRRLRALTPRGVTWGLVLADVHGGRVLLRRGDFERPEEWWPGIRRAVTAAQAPSALAALEGGGRLVFGPVWITADEVGAGGGVLRWSQVRRIEVLEGSVTVRAAGRRPLRAAAASGIPNFCVLHALAEHLTGPGRLPGGGRLPGAEADEG